MAGSFLETGVRRNPAFATTHWSVVLAAGNLESPEAALALERLCRLYWYPLYAYVRRRGYSPHDAEDLTQEFFARLLAKNSLALADRERGRFRTFLLSSLQNFLAKEWARATALKRGGGRAMISWDPELAEDRYRAEPTDGMTPEKIYEKRWATGLLEQALRRLGTEMDEAGKGPLFEKLKVFLCGDSAVPAYTALVGSLRMSEDALKMTVSRLRKRYRELVEEEIAHTVNSPAEAEEELRYLLAVLRG
jgi:RNA polymerase sigma-70 factor (ECF subfamily)